MDAKSVYLLKQPAKNRWIKFEDLKNGKVMLDNNIYESMREAEDYMLTIPRKDFKG